jgi:hypothetical protein
VLCQPPPALLCTPWFPLIWPVLGFEEYVPFDPSGNPVPPVFLQLPLIFFDEHSYVDFTLLAGFRNTFSFHTPISGLWGMIIRFRSSSEMTTFFLVHELDHADGEPVCVILHLASIT